MGSRGKQPYSGISKGGSCPPEYICSFCKKREECTKCPSLVSLQCNPHWNHLSYFLVYMADTFSGTLDYWDPTRIGFRFADQLSVEIYEARTDGFFPKLNGKPLIITEVKGNTTITSHRHRGPTECHTRAHNLTCEGNTYVNFFTILSRS